MAEASEDPNVREKFYRLEKLIQEVEKSSHPEGRNRVREIVRLLMDLHGLGLQRMIEKLAVTGDGGSGLIESLSKDALIGNLLLLYGLHPLELKVRVGQALEKARPVLRGHGGDVELLGIAEGIVHLRLTGSCNGCPSSSVTLRQTIEEAILEFAPDAAGIEVVGEEDAPPGGGQHARQAAGSGTIVPLRVLA